MKAASSAANTSADEPRHIIRLADVTKAIPLTEVFGVSRPLAVDVGCGKGRFLLARAAADPGTSFLGIDRMRGRLQKLDRKITRLGLENVKLVRLEAHYTLQCLLPARSVAVMTIFFPDPWPKRRHHRRRLFNPGFVDVLAATLAPGGVVHVATDHLEYAAVIAGLLDADPRFAATEAYIPNEDEKTDFELLFVAQGAPIGRCSYRRRAE